MFHSSRLLIGGLQAFTRTLCTNASSKFAQRSHTCGEIRSSHVGEAVSLCGWLQYRRNDRFLILRDTYGLVQVLIPDNVDSKRRHVLNRLPFESVLRVRGVVRERPTKERNPKMQTGHIEIHLEHLEVPMLNSCIKLHKYLASNLINHLVCRLYKTGMLSLS